MHRAARKAAELPQHLKWKVVGGYFGRNRAILWELFLRFASPLFNLLLNDFVTLTAGLLKLLLIENFNLAAAIVNQTCLLQDAGSDGYARTSGSEHLAQQILR